MEPNTLSPETKQVEIKDEKEKKIIQNYELNFNDKIYILTISLSNKNNLKDKYINFNLKEKFINYIHSFTYYSTDKKLNELATLFLININKSDTDIEELIISRIEKFHSKNNVLIKKSKKSDNILNLVYIQKIEDNDDFEINIELNKKNASISKEEEILFLNNEINNLKNELEKVKTNYERRLEIKEEENILLKSMLLKSNKTERKIEPLYFKSNPCNLTQCLEIKEVVDGGRGVNDHFAVYNLVKDKNKSVYVAIKNKMKNSENSFINIIKIESPTQYNIIKRLYGHKERINFVKYFLDPYTDNEYLLSADREEVVIVWKIFDENNYKRFCYIKTFYGRLIMNQSIYNCLIFFTERKNYIYTTTVTKNFSRLYELEDGSFLRDVSITLYNYTLYLIKYKEYIIDVCRDYVVIYNPFNEEIYDKIEKEETKGENRSACITYNKNNTDYLNISNQYGFIIIYDINKKDIFKTIKTNADFYHIISWDLNYLIAAVHNHCSLWIIDFDGNINKNVFKSKAHLICVKKFILKEKEIILCAGGKDYYSLYIFYSSSSEPSSKE